ncbi:hypothetical protein TcWFU_004556 [Taenia crassiceps]|uniref:Uncharacterized protein n=1 Tax=Taenia crassiceps TaxID=6207 RepID=A0ABR4QGE6_9CEST
MTACVGLLVCGLAMGCYVGGAVMPPEGYRCAKVSLVRETRPSLRVYMKALYEQRELLAAGLVERKSRPLTLHYFLHYVYLQLYTGKRIVLKVVALPLYLTHLLHFLIHLQITPCAKRGWVCYGVIRVAVDFIIDTLPLHIFPVLWVDQPPQLIGPSAHYGW